MWDRAPFDESGQEDPESVLHALEFAAWAHATKPIEVAQDKDCGGMQTRTDHRENKGEQKIPYIVHPMRVVSLLSRFDEPFVVQRAGACHDILEDTTVKLDELANVIGREALEIVMWVTDHEFSGSRGLRSWLKDAKLARAPREAKVVKLADMVNNTETLGSGKASFWRNCRRAEMLTLLGICETYTYEGADTSILMVPEERIMQTNEELSVYLLQVINEADQRYPEKEK